ncbi:MAG: 50S ribosomal protein L17 [Candidatus Epulonipiscioides saccharophilum]|nr:MAG: 50S ribosomal protein L17 [Epulopiscium sp. AS2M-Bin001]
MSQRKLGRYASARKALLRNQVTNLLYHGKIKTTEAKAKEIRKIAEKIIAMGVREHDNYEEITVTAKVPKKDKEGRRIRVENPETNKRETQYEEIQKTIKKDSPTRLHARRQMLKFLYPVTEVEKMRKRKAVKVDMVDKIFSEIAPKYTDRNGGYTRITKLGARKGDAAPEVIIELI